MREQSITTKLRVVFNASSRSSSGVSLNDIPHSGPKLQTNITDVLLWIRKHRYIFSSDIVKMFRQVAVYPDDWKFQQILWLDEDQHPETYQITTVTYGLKCAPFLVLRYLQQLIEDDGSRFLKVIAPLSNGRYVDDIFGGADSIEEAREIARQVSQLCLSGGFPLQKWHANHPELLAQEFLIKSKSLSNVTFEPFVLKMGSWDLYGNLNPILSIF